MPTNDENGSGIRADDSRRKFLKSAARIAVYTPPAMLIMSQPSYATFKKTGGYEQQTYTRGRRLRISKKKKTFFGRFLRALFR